MTPDICESGLFKNIAFLIACNDPSETGDYQLVLGWI